MQPTISVKNIRLSQRLESYVNKKTDRLDRYLPTLAELHVDLSTQKARNSAERSIAQITVRDTKGTILRAEEQHADIYAAIDVVIDKMYRQIKRYRGKRLKNRRAVAMAETYADFEPLPFDDEPEPNTNYHVVRQKRFPIHPMSTEEAIDQMELLGHDFYMFFNSEEEAINVVYRRRELDYGLLQPEL